MKSIILKSVLMTAVCAGLLTSCVNDDDYDAPIQDCIDQTLTANKTVQEIIAQATPAVKQYVSPTQDVIEAYVTSSDEGGNFYKSISFQTFPTDGSAPVGFSVPVDVGGTFTNYKPGTKVYIKLNDLYTDTYNGSMRIGALYELNPATETQPATFAVGRLSIFDYGKVLQRSTCTIVNEEDLVRKVTVSQAINDANLNTLIELKDVQFVDDAVGKPYYDANNDLGGATNRLLSDRFGNTIIFRTSSFANFAGDIAPSLSGNVRGVLTKFGSDYQFLARTTDDIKLTEPRQTIDATAPIIGSAIAFSGSFTENFESYGNVSPANRSFPKYINDPVVGGRYWANTLFGGNKYIQMSSFGGTAENNRTLFFVPVDMSAASTFSFQSKAGFKNGEALKVYYILASDYEPGDVINDSALVNITSNFTLSPGLPSGYPNDFTNSGNYAIPASVTGNGYFVFEYVGSGLTGGVTTTVQIDNIVVN